MTAAIERKAGVIISYLSMAVSIISGIVYVPFLLSTIGQEEYGLYQLLGGLVSYAALFDFGLSNTISRFYIKYKQEGDKQKLENMLAMSRILFWIITGICLLVFLIIYFNLQRVFPKLESSQIQDGKIIFLLLTVSICVSIPTYVYQAISNAEEKFIFLRGITLATAILQPVCVILLVMQHPSAITVVAVQTSLNVILAVVKIAYVKLNLRVKFRFHKWDKQLLKSLFTFSFFIFLNTVIDQVNWEVGKTLVGILLGDTAVVTVLSLGLQLGKYYMMFSSNISSVFFPVIQRSVLKDDSMQSVNDIFIRVGRIQALILGLILTGFVVFGQEFIIIWGGSENSGAFYIALALMLVLFIPLTQNVGISILQAKNIHKYRSLAYLVLSIINIGVSIPCIMKLGAYGAAIGTVISFFVGNNILMNIFYKVKAGIDIQTYFKFIVKFVLFMAVMCIPLYFVNRLILVDGYLLLIAKILAYTCVYCVFAWIFIMNKYEKGLVLSVFGKIKILFKRKKNVEKPAPEEKSVDSYEFENIENRHICIKNKSQCCGCESCVNSCPVQCIVMEEDKEGFRYPVVDESKCIKCGKCLKACFYSNNQLPENVSVQAYACYNSNEEERKESSSGGLFILFAQEIIARGGAVYGAAFDAQNGAVTMRADTMEECARFRGSKYVQSCINNIYADVRQDLENGKFVLFTGTPCQINGLNTYLSGVDCSKLFCVDIICHGVPSTLMFRKYVEYLEEKYKSKVKYIGFRDKKWGWLRSVVVVVVEDGRVLRPKKYKQDVYTKAFLSDVLLRPACLKCVSKDKGYSSDITIGDYWGYAGQHSELFDDKGLSACVVRTSKGEELFNSVKCDMCSEVATVDDIVKGNPALIRPNTQKYDRQKFLTELKVRDFDVAVEVLLHVPLYKRAGRFAKRALSKLKRK